MRKILKIAMTELSTLFYSPVAWLILVVFTVQVCLQYFSLLETMLTQQFSRPLWYGITAEFFASKHFGVFPNILTHLYLYVPLLTMGLMSREYNSGTIKLLYAAPVTNRQIVLGKYLAMLLYNLLFVGILLVFVGILAYLVPDFDFPLALAGVLGVYLVVATYAAIGLYMSCLTSYQIVAAISTLGVLIFLNYVGSIGQDIPFIRDVTYWLSIRGRSDELIQGLIGSEDVLYFIIVITLFLTLSVMKLQSGKVCRTKQVEFARYATVVVVALFVGYLTTRPAFKCYADVSATKENTLAVGSQDILRQIDDDLKITTYVNLFDQYVDKGLPNNINVDKKLFQYYQRFKPDIKFDYVYYYTDTTHDENVLEQFPGCNMKELAQKYAVSLDVNMRLFMPQAELERQIDLSAEEYRFVRVLERGNGAKTFLRIFDDSQQDPKEAQISTALKCLVAGAQKVAFITGHGERAIDKAGDREYQMFATKRGFRYSLVNSGFEPVELTLSEAIPEEVDILVLADLNTDLQDAERQVLEQYIQRGGNLLIAGEPGKTEYFNPLLQEFGVSLLEGTLVQPSGAYADNLLMSTFTLEGLQQIPYFGALQRRGYHVAMNGGAALAYDTTGVYKVRPILEVAGQGVWNELQTVDFRNEKASLDTSSGEKAGTYTTMVALSRELGTKEQRIVVLGDADCMSNLELTKSRIGTKTDNFSFIVGMFRWLSNDEYPLILSRPAPKDTVLELDKESLSALRVALLWGLPAIFVIGWCVVWFRRKRR